MQDLWDIIKRQNLQIMGIKGQEVQVEGIENISNKIIAENFPNLDKNRVIQVKEAFRIKTDKKRTSPCHIITKT
jgi:hypothetical protein